LFKISRLITSPNPGTSSLPFGTCCGVLCVLPPEGVCNGVTFTVGGGAVVVVVAVVAGAACAGAASTGGGSAGGAASTGGGSGGGGGGSGGGGGGRLNGLAGFTGLLMFVGFVALITQLSCAVVQSDHVGSLYGVSQDDTLFCVIEPT